MKFKKSLQLISSIVVCNLAGFIGAIFTTPAIPTWYATLNKPAFNPPSWVFAPVWTAIFTLMGVSLYLLLRDWSAKKQEKIALVLFIIQLGLNILWSVIFFGWQKPSIAFLEIIILLILIILTAWQFKKDNQLAGYLFAPYILWVGFAAFLNLSIWLLN